MAAPSGAVFGGVLVEWMTGDADVTRFVELCTSREMPNSAFPDETRLRSLRARCNQVVLGVYTLHERELLGGAVLLPLRGSVARRLDRDGLADGVRIQPSDMRARWRRGGTDLYVSTLVAKSGAAPAVLRAATRELPDLLGNSSAFARVATPGGARAARYLRFQPHGGSLWRRARAERNSGPTLTPRRLAHYDNALNMLSAFVRVARPAILATYFTLLFGLLLSLFLPMGDFSDWVNEVLAVPTTSMAPVMGTAATAGSLALTVFFFTAQSRLSGINQYGVTAMYRVRDLVPLVLMTTATVACGTGFLLVQGNASIASTPSRLLAGVAVISQVCLLLFIVVLSLGLIRGLDPVAVARQFARELHGQDADEWGLVTVSDGPDGLKVSLNQRRVNFGLRDPLMPIHELTLSSPSPQRYGQLLSVLAERIGHEYGCRWTQQFPDSGDWDVVGSRKGTRRRDLWFGLRTAIGQSDRSLRRERLQLTMLLLHYFRRIHRNPQLKIQTDYRRQAAQFVLSRLITVIARTKPLPGVSTDETRLVISLCIDALLRVGADYSPDGVFAENRPEVPNELLRAFVTAIDALDANQFADLAEDAAMALNWLFCVGAADRDRILDSDPTDPLPTLTANKKLVRIVTRTGPALLPQLIERSPWEKEIPDKRVRESAK